jgi:nicotinamidase/pyrazinamidase
MARAVVVSDMLRGFMEEGYPLYCGARARHIIPNMQKLFEQELAKGSKIFYVCDHHDKDDPEFAMFPPHAVEGTIESEVIPEFKDYPGKILPKKTYSLFHNTTLDDELKKLKPETAVVCGVCTHIDFTADLHYIAGKPIAKRGRIPGITPNSRLKRIL